MGDEKVSKDIKMQEFLKIVQELNVKIGELENENKMSKKRVENLENENHKACCKENRGEANKETISERVNINSKSCLNSTVVNTNKTFAQTLKQTKNDVLIVKQIDKNNAYSSKMVSELKEKVDPVNLNVGVKGIKKISNGGIAVYCESGKDVQILKSEVKNKLGEEYQVLIPAGRKPIIWIST
ncbi:hypothetical protein WA026_018712 [Henosepilachna vigintioctopunctata]|uniref:Uncharacterized protein n=1 Tax=Henosepilachna vigintioctopunctata TaxID=420089 RepID=A0AAW1TXZ6_9CUCU